MDTSQLVLKFAKRFFAGTVLSRISGALRDVAMAVCFGSAPEIGAFMVAFRFSYLFRRLFGEGSLQAGFIPHYSSLQGKEGYFFYRNCAFSLLILLLFVVVGLEGILYGVSQLLNDDWRGIIQLSMKMLPGLIFICLYALNSAFLQAQKKYFLSSFAPVIFNFVWIIAALLCSYLPIHQAVQTLALGIIAAFILQWAMTAIQVRKNLPLTWKEWFSPNLFSSDLKKIAGRMGFGVIGVSAVQVNSTLDGVFSRISDLAGPIYLWYAIRIEQLPLALFGIALSGALLPPLSRAMAEGALNRYRDLLHKGIRHSAFLIIPCTFALFALGGPGLNLLYGHGGFTSTDVRQTLYCLWGYGIGLLPSVMILLLATGFYAQKSYKIPMVASLIAVGSHIILNSFLIFYLHLGAFSIALSTSFAALVNCSVLIYFCKVDVFSNMGPFFAKLMMCGTIALTITFSWGYWLGDVTLTGGEFSRSLHTQALQFSSMSVLFLCSFIGACYKMRIVEYQELLMNKKTTSSD